ncbi:FIST N-terminal domain-containing protein [Winogradskyella maritima]|uniref:FIST signal transduction protein n=1 Tax=Winogradskyella maritima TaxID=1517766 RepID=A0ABV8AHJ8_9FLAO|nr:FIST N-terminal domain-containing protein [Winogradskyella maritima]
MKAKNIKGSSFSEIKSDFEEAVQDGFKPNLAIIFCSPSQNRKELDEFFTEREVDIYGCTTAGEILDSEVFEHSSVIMLLDMKKSHYHIHKVASSETFTSASDMVKMAKEKFKNPAIVITSSGLTVDAEQIIKGVQSVDENVSLYGGLAGDDLKMESSFVFSNGFETNMGLLGLIIDEDSVNVKGMATSGWDTIGVEKTITKSEGNVVYTIDGESAVDVFVKFFQFTDSVYDKAEVVATNFAQYPLQMKKDNGNVVLRSAMMADVDSGSLIFAGGIPQGSKVKFSVPPGFDLIDKTCSKASELKSEMENPDAVVVFSCKARHLALGPIMEDEAGKLRGIWNKPLIGFFSYGEIGTAENSTCDFHNETCSLILLQEKA